MTVAMLESPTTRLRAPDDRDLRFFTALRNDLGLQLSLMASPRANPVAKVSAWLNARCDDLDALFYVIADTEADQAVGFVQLTKMNAIHGTAELGIAVSPTAQGKGHAKAALQLIEAYAAAVFGLRKVVLNVLADNERAIALYVKAGYRRVGLLEAHHYQLGAYRDVLIMEKRLGGRELA